LPLLVVVMVEKLQLEAAAEVLLLVEQLAQRDKKENKDQESSLKARLVQLDFLVLTAFVVMTAHLETLVSPETLAHQDVMASPVKRVLPDHLVDTS